MLEELQRCVNTCMDILNLQNETIEEWDICFTRLDKAFKHFSNSMSVENSQQISAFEKSTNRLIKSIEYTLSNTITLEVSPQHKLKLVPLCAKIHQLIFDSYFSLFDRLKNDDQFSKDLEKNLENSFFLIKRVHDNQPKLDNKLGDEQIKLKGEYAAQRYRFNIDFMYHVFRILSENQPKEFPPNLLLPFKTACIQIFKDNVRSRLGVKQLEIAENIMKSFEEFALFIQIMHGKANTFSSDIRKEIDKNRMLLDIARGRKPLIPSTPVPVPRATLLDGLQVKMLDKGYFKEILNIHKEIEAMGYDSFLLELFPEMTAHQHKKSKKPSARGSLTIGSSAIWNEEPEITDETGNNHSEDDSTANVDELPLNCASSIENNHVFEIDGVSYVYDHNCGTYIKLDEHSFEEDWVEKKYRPKDTNKKLPVLSKREFSTHLDGIWKKIRRKEIQESLEDLACFSEENRNDDYYKAKERCLRTLKLYREAIAVLSKMDRQDSTIRCLFAYHHLKLEDYDTSLSYCEKIAETDPVYDQILYILVGCYNKKGMYAEKLKLRLKLLEKNPKDRQSLIDVGYCYKKMGKLEDSLIAFKSALTLYPKDPTILLAISHTQESMCEFVAALKTLAEISPEEINSDAHLHKARLYIAIGDYDEAIHTIKDGLKLYPTSTNGFLTLYYRCLKKYSDANILETLRLILDSNLNHTHTVLQVAKCYRVIKQYDKAVALYEEILKGSPTELGAILGLAHCYSKMNRYDEALGIYEKLIKAHPENVDIVLALSRFYEDAGQYTKALDILERIPTNKPSLFNRLHIYKKMGRHEEAFQVLQNLKSMEPTNRLFQMEEAQYYSNMERYEEAIVLFQKTEGWEGNVKMLLGVVHCLIQKKKYNEALIYLNKASVIFPKHPKVIGALAHVNRHIYFENNFSEKLNTLKTAFQSSLTYYSALDLVRFIEKQFSTLTTPKCIQEIQACYEALLAKFSHSEELVRSYFTYMLAHQPEDSQLQRYLAEWPYLADIHLAYAEYQSTLNDGNVPLENFTTQFSHFTPGFLSLIRYYLDKDLTTEAEQLKQVCHDRFHGNDKLFEHIDALFKHREERPRYLSIDSQTSPSDNRPPQALTKKTITYQSQERIDDDFHQALADLCEKNHDQLRLGGYERVVSLLDSAESVVRQDSEQALNNLLDISEILVEDEIDVSPELALELNYKLGIATSLGDRFKDSINTLNAAKETLPQINALDLPQKQVLAFFVCHHLSCALAALNDYDRAIENINESLLYEDGLPDSYAVRGYYYFQKGDYLKALLDFNDALRLIAYTDIHFESFAEMAGFFSAMKHAIQKLSNAELHEFNADELFKCLSTLSQDDASDLYEQVLDSDSALNRFFDKKTDSAEVPYLEKISRLNNAGKDATAATPTLFGIFGSLNPNNKNANDCSLDATQRNPEDCGGSVSSRGTTPPPY